MSHRLTLPLATLAAVAPAFAQPCTPHWSDHFPPGLTGASECFALFDPDGDGPQSPLLVAGGQITNANATPTTGIAAWDGFRWRPLGDGLNDEVHSLAVYDADGDGPEPASLYAAGGFTHSGDLFCPGLARWDGTEWHRLPFEPNKFPFSLRSFDPDGDGPEPPSLFIGGVFTQIDGQPARAIIRWDGQAWHPVGDGLDGGVFAMESFDLDGAGPEPDRLVAAGYFPTGGGKALHNIAWWDGAAWQSLGGGTDSDVLALAVLDIDGPGGQPSALYAGGRFTRAGNQPATRLASFAAGQWAPIPGGADGTVTSLASFDPDGPDRALCAGGYFRYVGAPPVEVRGAAQLTQAGWAVLDPGETSYDQALALYSAPRLESGHEGEPAIYIGVSGGPMCAKSALEWDGSHLLPLQRGLACYSGAEATFDPDGEGPLPPELFVSTGSAADQVPSHYMARFDGQKWSTAGKGLSDLTYGFVVVDAGAGPVLYARGSMPGYVRQWGGSAWQKLGQGCDDFITELLPWDPDGPGPLPPRLLAAGEFHNAGGAPAELLALWDGAAWSPFSAAHFYPYYSHVEAATLWDADGDGANSPVLVIFGIFDTIDGKPYDRVALWDGAWHPLPEVPGGGNYFGAAQFDEDGPGPAGPSLFIVGSFYSAVRRWNGSEWTIVGDGFLPGGDALWARVLDPDGDGPAPAALYVGGSPLTPVGQEPCSVVRWDGEHWERVALVADLFSDGRVNDAAFFRAEDQPEPSLYAVGMFNLIDDTPSSNIAVLECAQPPCPADCNADGALDLFDFLCFVNLYNAEDPAADCTAEGDFDFFDFVCFINLFKAGC